MPVEDRIELLEKSTFTRVLFNLRAFANLDMRSPARKHCLKLSANG